MIDVYNNLDEFKRQPEFIKHPSVPDDVLSFVASTWNTSVKRSFCAFTITRNEPFYLPLWCSYYAEQFGEENLIILDNGTTDGSIADAKKRWPAIKILDIRTEEAFNWPWNTYIVNLVQRTCLKAYEVVVFSDTDEFLIPFSDTTLRKYAENFRTSPHQHVRARGVSIVHQFDLEPPMDRNFPLNHRSTMFATFPYSKTLISKVPLDWVKGHHRHAAYDDDHVDDDLALLHLREIDLGLFLERYRSRIKFKTFVSGSTFGSDDENDVKTYFRTLRAPWSSLEEFNTKALNVPEHWKEQISLR